jgi:hypothetical protein
LTVDSSSPYFTYAVAYDRHDPDGNFTALKVRIGVPGGTIPESIASLTVSGPNEMVHSFEPAEYSAGTNEYSHRALDHPQEGLYVFTMTDNNGTTAVTHWYHKNAGGTIPVLDESAFQVSGDPLAPTVSWSGVAGYPAHLYYRLSVIDQEGNSVYLSSYSPNSYRVIPAGRLQSGTSYNYRLEVVDAPYFPGYRHRANSGYHQYPKLSGGKN